MNSLQDEKYIKIRRRLKKEQFVKRRVYLKNQNDKHKVCKNWMKYLQEMRLFDTVVKSRTFYERPFFYLHRLQSIAACQSSSKTIALDLIDVIARMEHSGQRLASTGIRRQDQNPSLLQKFCIQSNLLKYI